ncbi:TPA: amino acid adenylation domain-containing protein [Bacillus paranthracis]|nr:amino acid adenylation domain-containing protein [Bacillus paranthracis]HDT6619832.1 amino acid adenylation domain-containing protein [Bacillus paranthracis]
MLSTRKNLHANLVRIQGKRVDLKKIERQVAKVSFIEQCAVIARKQDDGEYLLTAFVVSEKAAAKEELQLLEVLPPKSQIISMSSLPLTKEGTIDRQQLMSLLCITADEEMRLQQSYGKEKMAITYEEVFRLPNVNHVYDVMKVKETSQKVVSREKQAKEHFAQHIPAYMVGEDLTQFDMSQEPKTLVEVIHNAAKNYGNHGITFIDEHGKTEFLTYKMILMEAERMLKGLRAFQLQPQDKIIFQMNNDKVFVITFWACVLGGFIPVPITVPKMFTQRTNEADTLYNIWRALEKPYIVTNETLQDSMTQLLDCYDLDAAKYLAFEKIQQEEPDQNWHVAQSEDDAILLFTSGSTGNPKGVVQKHRSILTREISTSKYNHFSAHDIALNWMPLEHVGGIVMFHIKDTYLGRNQVQVRTQYVLSEPTRWLDLITTYKATITWAPNFAFALINKEIENGVKGNWDLSSMEFIVNAGEAINGYTAKKFLQVLSPYGLPEDAMIPVWGMSETCSGVVYNKAFRSDGTKGLFIVDKQSLEGIIQEGNNVEDTITFVNLGKPIYGVSIRIANQDNETVAEGVIGRLQIKGKNVLEGYYQNEEANKECFTEDGWYDTGDLAFIKDGCMAITGRGKDIIIINGVNFNGTEIEYVVEQVAGVKTSFVAACAVRDDQLDTDELAIFYSTMCANDEEIREQIQEIDQTIIEKFGVKASYIIPVEEEEIPKTNIGKIQRTKLSNQFRLGYYEKLSKEIDILLQNDRTIPAWFYEQGFVRKETEITFNPKETRKIVIVGESTAFVTTIKRKLEEVGHHCYLVGNREAYLSILKQEEIDDVINLLNYEKQDADGNEIEKIRNANENGIFFISETIKACGKEKNLRIFTVTNNCEYSNIMKNKYHFGTLDGFSRSVNLELPNLMCIRIDLDVSENDVNSIIKEIAAIHRDDKVVYREGKRYVDSLQPIDMPLSLQNEIALIKDGIYVVTGGLGGIGKEVCKLLLQQFSAKLFIVGRTALSTSPTHLASLEELQGFSKDVHYIDGDLSDAAFVASISAKVEEIWGTELDGILHLAGAGNLEEHWSKIDSHWCTTESKAYYEEMFAAKVFGTVNLFQLIEGKKDALFLHFSSVNSYFGGASFTAYAAANNFQDTFCQYVSNQGYKNAICINWSMWYDIGMSRNNTNNELMAEKGFLLLPMKQAVYSLLAVLRTGVNNIFVGLDASKSNIRKSMKQKKELGLKAIVYHTDEVSDLSIEAKKHVSFLKVDEIPIDEKGCVQIGKLQDLHKNVGKTEMFQEPQSEAEKTLAKIWRDVLKANKIGRDSNFFELGGHSINATQLVSKIYSVCRVRMPLKNVFQYTTLATMARVLEELLVSAVDEVAVTTERIPKILPRTYYDLSYSQQRIYFLSTMEKETNYYNILGAWDIYGKLDVTLFEKAIQLLMKKHHSLRATFEIVDGKPVQIIHDDMEIPVQFIDLTVMPEGLRIEEVDELMLKESKRVYNLANGPLMHCTIVKIKEGEHVLLIGQHHIISDGWSLGIFVKELNEMYDAFVQHKPVAETPSTISIMDFTAWHNSKVDEDQDDRQYWLQRFEGELPTLELPTDRQRPLLKTYHGDTLSYKVNSQLHQKLKDFSHANGVTMFMTLLTAYNIMLNKLTNETDIVVGSPVAGRNEPESKDLIGMFVNTLALRSHLGDNPTVDVLLKQIKQNTLEAYNHQDYPFDKLVDDLDPHRDLSRTPIFQVMMGYMNMPLMVAFREAEVRERFVRHKVARFDLTLHVFEDEDQMKIFFEYNTDLFDESTIMRWQNHFETLLQEIVSNPTKRISELNILTNEEKYEILEMNNNSTEYPQHESVAEIFRETKIKHQAKLAITYKDRKLTYAELSEKANALAHTLKRRGVAQHDVVGIVAERSPETIIGILAILKVGAIYLPIDPKLPQLTLQHIWRDSGAKVLLGKNETTVEVGKEVPFVDIEGDKGKQEELVCPISPEDTAYIMYTSGSTGKPKGVMVTHRNIVRLVKNTNFVSLQEQDVLLQTGSLTFDAATFEIWGALLNGLTLHLVEDYVILDGEALQEEIQQNKATIMWVSAPLFNQLADQNPAMFTGIKQLLIGGDVLSPKHINKVMDHCAPINIINGYGPTENTTFSTSFVIDQMYQDSIPIGTPIANSSAYILDVHQNIQPIGVVGELCVGGDGVAKGYVNLEQLTEERFIADPFLKGSTMYRTGDYVKLLPNGNIQYIGRVDNQVKIRGFRIELEAIMNTLKQCESIKDVIVVVQEQNGYKTLVAYVVGEESLSIETVRAYAKKHLAEYMVPSQFIFIEEIPLSINGKVQYSKLPKVQEVLHKKVETLLPENRLEEIILRVYRDVLEKEDFGVTDSFFAYGGDSLLSIQVVSMLKKEEIAVDPKMIFMHTTVRELAKACENRPVMEETKRTEKDYLIQMREGSEEDSCIIFAPPAGGTVLGYIELARYFEGIGNVYGLQAPGLYDDEEPTFLDYDELVQVFLRSIEGTYRPGQDYLGGHSLGGHIAFGMCCELIKQGKAPKGLLILDTTPSLQVVKGAKDEKIAEEDFKMMVLAAGIGNMMGVDPEELKQLSYEEAKTRVVAVAQKDEKLKTFINETYLDKYLKLQIHSLLMSRTLELEKTQLDIPIKVFKTQFHTEELVERFDAWHNYTNQACTFIDIPGTHTTMMRLPHVKEVAKKIEEQL